jgi:hypothetical protein
MFNNNFQSISNIPNLTLIQKEESYWNDYSNHNKNCLLYLIPFFPLRIMIPDKVRIIRHSAKKVRKSFSWLTRIGMEEVNRVKKWTLFYASGGLLCLLSSAKGRKKSLSGLKTKVNQYT